MNDAEKELWRAKSRCDQTARNELVSRYVPLAKYWAKALASVLGTSLTDDFCQLACLGLVLAVDRFDLTKGCEFSTYARHWVRNRIFQSNDLTRGRSRQLWENWRKVACAHDTLMQDPGRTQLPTVPEISAKSGLSDRVVQRALDACQLWGAGSLDDPQLALQELGSTANPSPSPLQELLKKEKQHDELVLLSKALKRLTSRERQVVTLPYWGGLNDTEIATSLGVASVKNVRVIRCRALGKLRDWITRRAKEPAWTTLTRTHHANNSDRRVSRRVTPLRGTKSTQTEKTMSKPRSDYTAVRLRQIPSDEKRQNL